MVNQRRLVLTVPKSAAAVHVCSLQPLSVPILLLNCASQHFSNVGGIFAIPISLLLHTPGAYHHPTGGVTLQWESVGNRQQLVVKSGGPQMCRKQQNAEGF